MSIKSLFDATLSVKLITRSKQENNNMQKFLIVLLLFVAQAALAKDYPNMIGTWTGAVKQVQAGKGAGVAKGGMQVSETNLTVKIHHQEGATFMGKSRTSATATDSSGSGVWGTIRSTGDEAIFVTEVGASGHIWIISPKTFEFCVTNLDAEQDIVTAYCASLSKET
jgi:hypothetical protein